MKLAWFRCLASIVSCAILALPAFAGVSGAIGGRVVDPSGALVLNASVVLTSVETSARLTATTGSNGEYHFLILPVGHYQLLVTAQGFQPFEENGITINANDVLRIDIQFKVGSQSQKVEVRANPLQVETTSTQLGEVIGSQTILGLPLDGRSYTDLLGLQPGVAPASAGTVTVSFIAGLNVGSQEAGNLSVSGSREDSNGFVVNGGSVEDYFTNGTSVIPNLDSIAEFRLLTSNFDAEYGHFSGGLVNVVTKSGTNDLHGSAFVFVRNQDLDANNFFSDLRGAYSQYQPGGTIGGPIKRDKLFFFLDYQGTRATIGESTGLIAVPTADERNGTFNPATFTGLVNGGYWASILSQRLGTTVTSGEPYSSVFPGGVIPQVAWSTPSKNLLALFPQSNSQGYFSGIDNTTNRDDRGGARLDLIGNRVGTLSGYYFVDNSTDVNAFGNNQIPGWPAGTVGQDQQLNLSDVKTIGSKAVNEARLNYLRYKNQFAAPLGGTSTAESIGIPGYATSKGVPTMIISGLSTDIGLPPSTLFETSNTYQALDNFSRVVGAHNLKLGGEFDYIQWFVNYVPTGHFSFNGSETGNPIADFLLGTPTQLEESSPAPNESLSKYAGLYAQDSWRVRPNLTLNYGLRWEVSLPWYEKHNRYATIIPGEQSTIYPTAPVGLVYPGDEGVTRGITPTHWKNFSPRIGIAWAPPAPGGGPAKTSVRASYGIFYTSMSTFGTFFNNAPAPFQLIYQGFNDLLDSPYTDRQTGVVNNPFPFTPPPAGDKTINFGPYEPIATYPFLSNHTASPYTEQYSLSFQQQLDRQTVLTMSYVGNEGHHFLTSVELNPGNPALCLSLSQPSDVAPGTPTCGPSGEDTKYTRADGTAVASTRPYGPQFGSEAMLYTVANSNWNGLEVSLQHESGIARFLAGYTWGKSIDNSSSLSDQGLYPFDHNFTRGLSSFDVNQNFVFSYNVRFPFARLAGGRWTKLTDGWGLDGITRLSTGFPIRIAESDDRDLLGMSGVISGGPDVPDLTPGALDLGHGPLSGKPYFNTSLFSLDALGQFGNSNPRFFHGPGIVNFDTALIKNLHVTERVGLQFRAEMFNVFNHPQFENPSGNINSGTTFGVITAAENPRIGQVALRATF